MRRKHRITLSLLICAILLIGAATHTAESASDSDSLGCTHTNPNGQVIGMQPVSCSNILRHLACTLVPNGVDTISAGRFAGQTFVFDAECRNPSEGAQVYHYKTIEMVYKEGVNNYVGTHDTFIRPDSPDSVMPPLFAMEVVSRPGPIPWLRGLVRFANQQPLPSDAQILAAELTMVCQEAVPPGGVPGHLLGGGMNVSVYGLLKEFKQDEATWNHYASGLTWEVPGAEGTADRFTSADDTQFILTKCDGVGTDPSSPIGGDVVPTPYTWDVLSSYLAQRNEGKEEYGWVFFTLDEDEDTVRFFTHEMSNEHAPKLVVKYLN